MRNLVAAESNNKKKKKRPANPNPLIFRSKGHGMVPHLKGKIQTDMIESDGMVAIELYACVACMYSRRAVLQSREGTIVV